MNVKLETLSFTDLRDMKNNYFSNEKEKKLMWFENKRCVVKSNISPSCVIQRFFFQEKSTFVGSRCPAMLDNRSSGFYFAK